MLVFCCAISGSLGFCCLVLLRCFIISLMCSGSSLLFLLRCVRFAVFQRLKVFVRSLV